MTSSGLKIMIGLFIMLLVSGSHSFSAAIEAKKDGVKVTVERSKDSNVITTLKKGQELEAIERKGMYWQVKTDAGKEGFVSVMDVQRKANTSTSLSNAIRTAVSEGRPNDDGAGNSRARSAVMGVRGLDESSETAFAGNAKPNLRLVYQMEDRYISPKKISNLETAIMAEINALSAKKRQK